MSFGAETRADFVLLLGNDVSLNILMHLNDPVDVVCAGAVSHLWRQFVVTNGISKQLCLRKFPQLLRIARITEPDLRVAEGKDDESSSSSWETLKRDHNVYASLLQAIGTSKSCLSDCIGSAVSASSTDNYPEESIVNTLTPGNRYQNMPSYWSSIGHSDSNAMETLIYKLKADLCVITEINIQPFEGKPICSAKSVRFRLGHLKSSIDKSDLRHGDKFLWTYTSEEFPMRQLRRRRRHWWTLISVNGNLRRKKLSVITDGRLWVRKSPIICSSARIRAPGGTTISEKDVLLGSSRGCHKKP
ncbi:hypothetical protein T459_01358 [Capsicum annuum]|uniref:F-box domain-containing protein n=1 Tax=Capsicum annuum TaxID=4072 RepID=A0A2G3AGV4_CAPAN|nr:hypothetical protein T459_01358 [Capsicum annuum]